MSRATKRTDVRAARQARRIGDRGLGGRSIRLWWRRRPSRCRDRRREDQGLRSHQRRQERRKGIVRRGLEPDEDQVTQADLPRRAGGLGAGDEIAGMVAYLAGPEAAFVTGACLTIDGGFAA